MEQKNKLRVVHCIYGRKLELRNEITWILLEFSLHVCKEKSGGSVGLSKSIGCFSPVSSRSGARTHPPPREDPSPCAFISSKAPWAESVQQILKYWKFLIPSISLSSFWLQVALVWLVLPVQGHRWGSSFQQHQTFLGTVASSACCVFCKLIPITLPKFVVLRWFIELS